MAVLRSLLDEGDIATRLRQTIEQAIDSGTEQAQQRALAWRQFRAMPDGTEAEGRSAFISRDVNSVITAKLAQMAVSFQDQVATYPANNADDEPAAAAESRAVNKVLIEDNGGIGNILDAFQNALLYGIGYLKVWWKDNITRTTITIDNVQAIDLPIVIDSQEVGITRRLVSYDPDKGRARVEVTQKQSRLAMEAVANERFFIDPNFEGHQLRDECALAGEVHYKTRDELVRMGVDKDVVNGLPAVEKYSGTESGGAAPRRAIWSEVQPVVHQMDVVRCYEAYARLTFKEDDDRAYLYKCWMCDQTDETVGWLMEPYPVSRMPYACGTAYRLANQHRGEADAEKIAPIQAGRTQLMRQWFDNVQNASFGRYGAVIGQVEAADLLTPKAGAPIRIKSPTALVPIPVIDVGPSIKLFDDQMREQRTEAVGASLDMMGAEMQIAGDSAHGTERVYAGREVVQGYNARNLAPMIQEIFLLGHAELRDGDGGPINVKIGEQWQQVDPATWQPRTNVNVSVAPTFGERMQKANTLMAAIQMYGQGLQGGLDGVMLTLPGYHRMVVDWLTLNLIDDAESYFVDPLSPQAQQAGQQKTLQAQQQANAQADLQGKVLAIPETIKQQVEKYKADQEIQFKYFDATLDAIVKANQAETEGAVNVATAGAQAKAVQNANAGNPGQPGKGTNGSGANGRGNGAKATGGTGAGSGDAAKGN